MKNKYNRKYQVSYKTNVDGDSHRGYFETIYLYPEETEIDLINKIEERIISVYEHQLEPKIESHLDYITNVDEYVFTLEEWFNKNKTII